MSCLEIEDTDMGRFERLFASRYKQPHLLIIRVPLG